MKKVEDKTSEIEVKLVTLGGMRQWSIRQRGKHPGKAEEITALDSLIPASLTSYSVVALAEQTTFGLRVFYSFQIGGIEVGRGTEEECHEFRTKLMKKLEEPSLTING